MQTTYEELKNQGGRWHQNILSHNWSLVLSEQWQVKTLQSMVQASRALKEIQETPTWKRTAKHLKQHEKQIKKQCAEQCTATLLWLENEGLTSVSVTVMNNGMYELQFG